MTSHRRDDSIASRIAAIGREVERHVRLQGKLGVDFISVPEVEPLQMPPAVNCGT